MKKFWTLLCCLFVASVHAQNSGGGIKVTAVMHEDGTKTVTTTDADQRTSQSVDYGPREKVIKKVIYKLNANNVPESGVVYSPNGQIAFKAAYKRDASNRVTEETDYAPNGTMIRRFVYEYSATGKVSRIRAYDAAGNEMHQTQSPARKDEPKSAPRRRR